MTDLLARRAFLRAAAAAGAAWATAILPASKKALAWAARQAAALPSSPDALGELSALTPAQARMVDAAASRIIPSVDGRPGAHDAGVVYFIDVRSRPSTPARSTLTLKGVRGSRSPRRRGW